MNQKALKTLEYNKIIDKLVTYASSPTGKHLCETLVPYEDLGTIETLQQQTAAALSRLFKKGHISFGGAKDIRPSLKRLEVGSTLGVGELMKIASLLENANRVKSYGRHDRDDEPEDCLDIFFASIEPLTPVSGEIRRCILSEEEISDDASPTLRSIRRSMKQLGDKIHTELTRILGGSAKDFLQDSLVTTRNGRYCIPVKAEHKNAVSGIIHDQSSTGSTVFIEPAAIVKLNNDIRQLEIREEEEIEVILANLSELCSPHLESLHTDFKMLTELDFIFARASLAMEQNATMPIFNTKGYINLKKARHPLIDKKKVVPIDVSLGGDFQLLIITGPNTGGKTVSLKTVGLLTLMGQAGLHIPTMDRSELSVFEEVYADIGDEQSIEQSLSTFSSHMTNVVSFIEKADYKSLVLFDELGAGTDPTEGAALAIAILSTLHKRQVRTMATTHYSELKMFALSTPGVENGSCEFNVETLSPTYRLLIGVPGKSNAFAISSKLGLPEYIIQKAREQLSEEAESFEDVITNLEESRLTLEREQEEIARYKKEIESLKSELEDKQQKLTERREKIIGKANEEAKRILQEAKDYADETMRKFNKFGKENISAKEMEHEREKLRKKLSKTENKLAIKPTPKKSKLKPEDLHIGDAVKILSLNLKGTVNTRPDSRGNLFVMAGIMRTKVNVTDLELLDEEVISTPSLARTSTGKIKMSKSASVSTEINLLGKTVDEAIAELDKYLDDAYIAHLPSVRVVHGKGTGALRAGVHKYLKKQRHVKSFRLGEFGEGDAGVTIVEFKK